MQQDTLASRITQQVKRQLGVTIAVGETADAIMLSGPVASTWVRTSIEQIAQRMAQGKRIENFLEVEQLLPIDQVETTAPADDQRRFGEDPSQPGLINPEFAEQPLETNEGNVANNSVPDLDPSVEPEPTFFAPTDPVIGFNNQGNLNVLGGFAPDATSDVEIDLSAEDNRIGDEALGTAISDQLHRDATTTDLQIDVAVENGVVHLRGRVPTLQDASNAEAVAGQLPGVREVVDELDVATM